MSLYNSAITIQLDNKEDFPIPEKNQYVFTYTRENTIANKPPKVVVMTPQLANYHIFQRCYEYVKSLGALVAGRDYYREFQPHFMKIALEYVPLGIYRDQNQLVVESNCVAVNNVWDSRVKTGDYLFFTLSMVSLLDTSQFYDVGQNIRLEALVPLIPNLPPVHFIPQWSSAWSTCSTLSFDINTYQIDDKFREQSHIVFIGRVVLNNEQPMDQGLSKRSRLGVEIGDEEGERVMNKTQSRPTQVFISL